MIITECGCQADAGRLIYCAMHLAAPDLLAALQPLADIYDPSMDDRRDESPAYGFNDKVITYGDIRRAITAIETAVQS